MDHYKNVTVKRKEKGEKVVISDIPNERGALLLRLLLEQFDDVMEDSGTWSAPLLDPRCDTSCVPCPLSPFEVGNPLLCEGLELVPKFKDIGSLLKNCKLCDSGIPPSRLLG